MENLNDFVEKLKKRGIVSNYSNENKQNISLKNDERIVYFGIDCTSNSLHIGHLYLIVQSLRFAQKGFKVIIVLGASTSKIGDPSDKDEERPIISEEKITNYTKCIKDQIEKIIYNASFLEFFKYLPLENFLDNDKLNNVYEELNLEKTALSFFSNIFPIFKRENITILENKWLENISLLSFINNFGRKITINYLIGKKKTKERINSERGISFSEFTYSLLQSYDFFHLLKNYNCNGQIGSSDQWGNMTTGLKIINSYYPKNNCFIVSFNLLVDKEGKKISKTSVSKGHNKVIWMSSRTSFLELFNFLSNMEDNKAEEFIEKFTTISDENIKKLKEINNPKKTRIFQKVLIELFFWLIHGKEGINFLKDK